MKNRIFNTGITALSLFITLTFFSCSSDKTKQDSKDAATEKNGVMSEAKEADAQFLVNAAEINLKEIQLGQLAETNSMMLLVKELGKTMEEDHVNAQKNLQELAAKKEIAVPSTLTENGQDAYKKLMEKTGTDFDDEYCSMMIDGHKEAIAKFTKASTDATDPDIKAWAASMLPDLQKHLDEAMSCQEKSAKM